MDGGGAGVEIGGDGEGVGVVVEVGDVVDVRGGVWCESGVVVCVRLVEAWVGDRCLGSRGDWRMTRV